MIFAGEKIMKSKIKGVGAAFLILALFSSCVSTYNTVDVDIISDSPENSSLITRSAILLWSWAAQSAKPVSWLDIPR